MVWHELPFEFGPRTTSGKDLIMWSEEPDILDALEEHDFECESTDDFSEMGLDSDVEEEVHEDEYEEDSAYSNYEG
jgi:hypothetical protein